MTETPLAARAPQPSPGFLYASMRVFDLSIGEMLWSRRTVFMGLLVGVPLVIACILRVLAELGAPMFRVNNATMTGPMIFAFMLWLLYIRFTVPLLGVFYGTSLIADEVEDKTITYLFLAADTAWRRAVRQVPRVPHVHRVRRPAVDHAGLAPRGADQRIAGAELSGSGEGSRVTRDRPGRLWRGVRCGLARS
jgi:hypothetical protein